MFCIHLPCGIFYIWNVVSNSVITSKDWIFAIVYLLVMIGITVVFGQVILSSKDSKYAFDESEIKKGERFARMMGLDVK